MDYLVIQMMKRMNSCTCEFVKSMRKKLSCRDRRQPHGENKLKLLDEEQCVAAAAADGNGK